MVSHAGTFVVVFGLGGALVFGKYTQDESQYRAMYYILMRSGCVKISHSSRRAKAIAVIFALLANRTACAVGAETEIRIGHRAKAHF